MKKSLIIKFCIYYFLVFTSYNLSYAQVGINTTTPNGALDITSTTSGVVFPRVKLAATNIAGPVVNPNGGGNPVAATFVYNTNTTTNGPYEVSPGLYMWDGSKWIAMFNKFDSERFQQDPSTVTADPFDPNQFRTQDGSQNITGLINRKFTPKYTGVYELKLSTNFGSGQIETPGTGQVSVGTQEGLFIFSCNNGIGNIEVYAHSYSSVDKRGSSPDDKRYAIWRESTTTKYVSLIAGTEYTFNLSFTQYSSDRFDASSSGDGRGYIGLDIPCEVVWSFKKEN
tara:strand:- start:460 stop:1308 length:849 start_codon:yes stop_codon:yes gene_type:complete